MADENPFDTGAEANPFADPSAQASDDAQLPEMYNPFAPDGGAAADSASYGSGEAAAGGDEPAAPAKKKKKKKKKNYGDDAAWPSGASDNLSGAAAGATAAAATAGAAFGAAAGSAREQALMVREQALMRKEAELADRERRLASLLRDKNWPFKCYPVAYHDISAEFRPEDQPIMSKFYVLVRLTWLCLFLNWIGSFVLKFDADGDASNLLWSSIYMLLGVPLSWLLWYRSVYSGVRDNNHNRFIFFFVNFFIHICFCIVMSIGINATAGIGFITFASTIDDHKTSGIWALVMFILWLINILFSCVLLRRAHNIWKAGGGEDAAKKSLAKQAAKQQFSNAV